MSEIKNYNKFIDEIIKEVEDELEESTTTGNVDGYQTPYAFGDDSEKNKNRKKQVATQAGYSVVDNDVKNIDETTGHKEIDKIYKNKEHLMHYLYYDWNREFPMFNDKDIVILRAILSKTPNLRQAESLLKDVKKSKKLQDSIKQMAMDIKIESVDESKDRDYAAEYQARKKDYYKKYQSSDKAKKYRAELNQYNREKGTYGNGDGLDASHKGGKIAGFETENKNRSRKEKSRLKKEDVNETAEFFDSKAKKIEIGNTYIFTLGRTKTVIKIRDIDPVRGIKIYDFRDRETRIIPISTWNAKKYGHYMTRVHQVSESLNESSIPKPIQSLIDNMVKNKIQRQTVNIKDKSKHDMFMKDVQPAIDKKLLMVKHNPIKDTEMWISLGPESQKLIESLNEATSLIDMFRELQSFSAAGVTSDDIKKASLPQNKKINVNNNAKLKSLVKNWSRGEYDESPDLLVQSLRHIIGESIDSISDAKKTLSNVYKIVSVENVTNQRKGPKNYIKIQYIPKTSPQTQNVEFHKIFYTDTNEGDEILKTLKLKLTEAKQSKRTNRWLELKNDESMHGHKKLAVGLKELKYQLAEVEKFLGWYNKLKNINELDSDNYWKRTNNNIYKIKERLINIVKKIQEIEK